MMENVLVVVVCVCVCVEDAMESKGAVLPACRRREKGESGVRDGWLIGHTYKD